MPGKKSQKQQKKKHHPGLHLFNQMSMHHTKYKEHLHCYVTAYGAAAEKGVVVTSLIVSDKADIVRYSDGNVEGCQQDEPVPQGLGDAVVQKDET